MKKYKSSVAIILISLLSILFLLLFCYRVSLSDMFILNSGVEEISIDNITFITKEDNHNALMTGEQAVVIVAEALKDTDTSTSNTGFLPYNMVSIAEQYYIPVKHYGISLTNPSITTKINIYYVNVVTKQVYILEEQHAEGFDRLREVTY